MATKLEKPIHRETTVNGVETIVTLSPDGFVFNKKRSSIKTTIAFADLIKMIHDNLFLNGDGSDETKESARNMRKTFGIEKPKKPAKVAEPVEG